MKILLYIAKKFNVYFLVLLAIFVSIDLIFTSINESKAITMYDYNLKETILFIVLAIPRKVYVIAPWIAMLTTLLTLGNIAKHSELIILQVSGLSPLKIASMVIFSSLPLLTILFLCGEIIAPKADKLLLKIRIRDTVVTVTEDGMWSRNNYNFIKVMGINNKDNLEDVTIFEFDKNLHLHTITHAEHATKLPKSWELSEMTTTTLQNRQITSVKNNSKHYKELINTGTLGSYSAKYLERLSITKIYKLIKQREENNLRVKEYEVALWKKLTQPLSIIMMILLAVPLSFSSLRQSSIGAKLLTGVLIGFSFYIINSIAYSSAILTEHYNLALIILTPNILILIISLIFFNKINK